MGAGESKRDLRRTFVVIFSVRQMPKNSRDLELDLQTGSIENDRVSAGIYGRLQEHAYLATGGLRLRHIVPGLRPRAFCHELPSDEVS